MVTEGSLNLKQVIDFLRLHDRESIFCKDWARLEYEDGVELWRKDEFRCELYWQKVKVYERSAAEFLSFAKQNLRDDSGRGRADALSNADTAIRCRVDELLELFNLKPFFVRRNLGQKLEGLKPFEVPTPDILKRLITDKRNRLRHDYIGGEKQESQDAVEVAELFLKATDPYVEKGYIASAKVAYISWFKPAIVAATWFEGELGQFVTPKYGYHEGISDEYKLEFDLERKTITLSYQDKEVYRRCSLKTEKEKGRKESVNKEKGPDTKDIRRDCKMEDVRELMILLREKHTKEITV